MILVLTISGITFTRIDQLYVFGNYSKGRTAYRLIVSISEIYNREDYLGICYKTKDNSLLVSVVVL